MNRRFRTIITICQQLKEKHGFNYEKKCAKKITAFSQEIIEKKLIDKCTDKTFAKQLCIANNLKYKS